MALSNDMTLLIRKIFRRLGLIPIESHLPEFCNIDRCADVIMEDTLVTFSRFYPYQFKMKISDETCYKKKDEFNQTWYYIKDEILEGVKLLGMKDIDWTDTSTANASLTTGSTGMYYYPTMACPAATYESMLSLQSMADFTSLYNRQIYIDFQYPNRFALKGVGNLDMDLSDFVVILLVQHSTLSTISPTKMNIFEELAQADVASFLYDNLKYWDGLETAFVNIDLKLSEMNDKANKRESIIDKLENSYVSTSNDNIPYIMTV